MVLRVRVSGQRGQCSVGPHAAWAVGRLLRMPGEIPGIGDDQPTPGLRLYNVNMRLQYVGEEQTWENGTENF